MFKKHLLFTLLLCIGFTCFAQTLIKSNDSHIHYMGRIDFQDTAAVLSWPGTSLKINFNGTGVKALMSDERGDNYYNIIVDGEVVNKLHPDQGKKEYTLIADLPAGKHTLELFKRTEWGMGKTWFNHFILEEGTTLLPPPPISKRKIEFFGNSISCGYAVEDTTGQDRGTAPFENNYVSYAALTARHFNAEYYCTAKSGIGITVSWFPLIMPEMYDRLDGTQAESKWDFSKYTPDVVVINLFQNDSWLINKPEHEQFKARFGNQKPTEMELIEAYRNFVKSVRSKYKKAKIICVLGSMDATQAGSAWPGYVKKAVSSLKDKAIYTHFFPYKNTPGHPNVKDQQIMANDLISYMEKNIKW